MQLPDPPAARELARRLGDLGFSVDGVEEHLGPVAAAALARDSLVPVRRFLDGDRSARATAIRLFLLADAVPVGEVVSSLGDPDDWGDLLMREGGSARSALEISPYAADSDELLVAADWPSGRTGRPLAKDHVLGVGGASTLLAQCTVRPRVEKALDIGTGCGVQALHLSQHSTTVVATDLSSRCVSVAGLTFALNGLAVTTRQGSLFDPVGTESFDLIVSNPPFVIGSPTEQQHDYRDSGLAGDGVCASLVRSAAERLNLGGWFQMLANWEIVDADDWSRHPRSWLKGSPLDAWVVQRDVQDPASYVENWLSDAGGVTGAGSDAAYEQWLDALEQRGVVGIGFGLVTLRSGQRDEPTRILQHVPQPLVQPIGPDIERWFAAQDVLAERPSADVLMVAWRVASDVEVIDEFVPGAGSHGRSVRRRTGLAWSGPIDDFGVRLLARADGATPLGEVVVSLAGGVGSDPVETLAAAVPVVRQLVAEGFLVPPGRSG